MHISVTTCIFDAHFTVPGCWDSCGVLQETQNFERTRLFLPPQWPQLFDQPPPPNRQPRSQFLSNFDRSSGENYLPPLTNASITCELPSSSRLYLEIDHTMNNTLIPPFLPPPDQIAPPEVNSCPFWCCPVPSLCRLLCCHPSPSSCCVVVSLVLVVVLPVALLTLAVIVSPVVVVFVVAAAFVVVVIVVVAIYHPPSP